MLADAAIIDALLLQVCLSHPQDSGKDLRGLMEATSALDTDGHESRRMLSRSLQQVLP